MRRRGGAVDQQRLGRAADAGAAHLRVQHDLLRHREVGGLVDIDVHDAFEMREHRHARLGLHTGDQALAAARHDHVDIAVEPGEHQADGGAVARRHQLYGVLGKIGGAQAFGQRRMDRSRGAEAFRAAAQDHGIAGLEAEHRCVRRHVRAAFVDHADHAERHAHALDDHAVRPRPAFHHGADWIGQIAHHRDAVRHRGDALRRRAKGGRGMPRSCRRTSLPPHPRRWRREFPPRCRGSPAPWRRAPCRAAPSARAQARAPRPWHGGRYRPSRPRCSTPSMDFNGAVMCGS